MAVLNSMTLDISDTELIIYEIVQNCNTNSKSRMIYN